LYRLFGLDPESDSSSFDTAYRRIYPEDRATFDKVVERAIRERSDFEVDFRTVLPDGSTKYLRSIGHPVFSASGELVEFVGTGMDMTERRQAEKERERLREAQAALAHINRVTTMGELTASLAHELNQPIAAAATDANTCLRWLARDEPDLEEARAAASRVVMDAARAAEIMSRVRTLFKKEGLQRELVDVNDIIREMIDLLRSEATRYSISIRTELSEDLPQIMGDRVQLQQVTMNLIINSIDAMKDLDGIREIAITSQRAENEQLQVSVSDTGIGRPSQQADQIFNAFFTTKGHGTGMGLRISRSIIESHGGRLWASDNSPRGASFSFTLSTEMSRSSLLEWRPTRLCSSLDSAHPRGALLSWPETAFEEICRSPIRLNSVMAQKQTFGQPRSKRWLDECCFGSLRHISSAYSLLLHPKTISAESDKTISFGLPLLRVEGATGCSRCV
jgi:signal transduction histidine kinase